jgi:hypothetical protein
MRRIALVAVAATALTLLPAASSAQSSKNCRTSSSSRIQGLVAGGGATCRKARSIARQVGNRNPRRAIRVQRYRCRVVARNNAARGWACNKSDGKFASWAYVTG